MKKIFLSGLLASGLLLTACNGQKTATPKTEEDKTFFTVGHMFGQRLARLNLSEAELNMLTSGLRAGANDVKPEFKINEYQPKVRKLFQERMKKHSEKVSKEGVSYLENFVAKEGGKKTASGLAYKIIKKGEGKMPKATDTVEVHYHGTLIDGTVFDSSRERGKKISFPLNRVIKGWTEGLQLLKEGGSIKLVIPAKLAYGENGAPPKIPGGATLIFDIELFQVNPKKK